jgi:dihydropyrimidine dehydrogenase (NAD+) subunit PreT
MSSKTSTPPAFDKAFYDAHFAPIKPDLRDEEARLEAERCLYCYDAPCVQACPTRIEIPRFIKQIAQKNPFGSAKTIFQANALGHSCAKACPTEVLCEGACVFTEWQQAPIQIGRLQAHATGAYHRGDRKAFKPGPDSGKQIAVVGAGPAGLACAFYLRRLGHSVTLFEKREKAGGLNHYGVAEYKMTQEDAQLEVQSVLDMGAKMVYGVNIGKDRPLAELEKEFDAVFIGFGLAGTRRLGIPGEELTGSLDALGFIEYVKDRRPQDLPASQTTVVIGAGNTSIDAVTQSKRIGTERVVLAYRRGEQSMSAYGFEYDHAKKDGVEFQWHASPKEIVGTDKVEGVTFIKTRQQGAKLEEIPGSEFTIPCDRVIRAIGQTKHLGLAKKAEMDLREDGRVKVDPKSLQTSRDKVWAGGDAINGGREVVNAAADGKRAAWHMHVALTGNETPSPENAKWVRTIENELLAPIPARGTHG